MPTQTTDKYYIITNEHTIERYIDIPDMSYASISIDLAAAQLLNFWQSFYEENGGVHDTRSSARRELDTNFQRYDTGSEVHELSATWFELELNKMVKGKQ